MVTLRIALRALAKHKMRGGLTILGIVIGIAAVTTMVSVGQSAGDLIQQQFEGLGTNMIAVFPGTGRRGGVRQGVLPTLTASDAEAIARECPTVRAVSPLVGASGQVIHGNDNWNPKEMFGVGPDYLTVRNWTLDRGGIFTKREVAAADKVCVIGETVARNLFQTTNPLGQSVRIRNIPFRVIGVLEAKGANLVGDDQDDILLMPHTTVRKRLYGSEFDHVADTESCGETRNCIKACNTRIEKRIIRIAADEKVIICTPLIIDFNQAGDPCASCNFIFATLGIYVEFFS